jgi:hypothetical protein
LYLIFQEFFLPHIFNQWEKLRVWIPFILSALYSSLLSAIYFIKALELVVRTFKIKRNSETLRTETSTCLLNLNKRFLKEHVCLLPFVSYFFFCSVWSCYQEL